MKSVIVKEIIKFGQNKYQRVLDKIVVEEPLDIYINSSKTPRIVTMRTPGDDLFLALGLLFSLEIISSFEDVVQVNSLGPNAIYLSIPDYQQVLEIYNLRNSSCGLCNGKSWEDIASHSIFPIYDQSIRVEQNVILTATQKLYSENDDFSLTGGNHKVALLDNHGRNMLAFEDVGRHNAFDKAIGQCLKEQKLPLSNSFAVLSGRCSYEMCLKAWQSGIPLIISKGAPTSKAIELAEAAGITLVGFALKGRFNIYSHPYRIIESHVEEYYTS